MRKNLFKNRFLTILEADLNVDLADDIDDAVGGDPVATDKEQGAFEDSLDNSTDPDEFLASPANDKEVEMKIDQRNDEISRVIRSWIKDIEEFVEKLNGTNPKSLQSILGKAQTGTLFAKIQSSSTRKIGNCAQELSALAENLKTFVSQKAIK